LKKPLNVRRDIRKLYLDSYLEGCNMNALIAYGTRYGSTTDIANKMGNVLKRKGMDVTIINLGQEKINDISKFDLVIVGSGIAIGKWTKKPLKFISRFESELAKKKVALFVSCGDAKNPDKHEDAKKRYLENIIHEHPMIKPVKVGLFGGVIDLTKVGFLTRSMLKAASKEMEKDGIDVNKRNDFRDWKQIEEWTNGLVGL
jgi:menaquinone-dependent protoporphyrinogen oxidase